MANEKAQQTTSDISNEYDRYVTTRNDSLYANQTDGFGAFANRGTVTINIDREDEEWNKVVNSDSVIEHETKHNDNHFDGIYAYAMSPEQYYKINMHDEISANLANLVYLRDQYLKTGDISIFEKEVGGYFAFYGEAIKNGLIEPNSPDPEKFSVEMSFMVNGTQEMWEERFAKSYISQNLSHVQLYFQDNEGKYAEFYDENYANALKKCYNIGGIDFTQYIKKDVTIPDEAQIELQKSDQDKLKNVSNAEIAEKFGLPPYQKGMSLEEYAKLLQHHNVLNSFINKVHTGSYVETVQSYNELLNHKQFKSDYDECVNLDPGRFTLEHWQDKQKSELALAAAARECLQTDGKFSESDGTTYQQAVDELYTFSLSNDTEKVEVNLKQILNPHDNLHCYSSQRTEQILTQVKGDYDSSHKSFWQRTTEAVGQWWNKPFSEKISDIKDGIKNIFTKEEPQKETVQNEIVNEINRYEYADVEIEGHTYSPVMQRKILDLRKDIICKPCMIQRPQGYDVWLQEHSLVKILENLPNFFAGKMEEYAAMVAKNENSHSDDKAGVRSQMRQDAVSASYVSTNNQANVTQHQPAENNTCISRSRGHEGR